MHPVGVEETATTQPGRIGERYLVEYQRIALPASHGVPQKQLVKLRILAVLAVIRRDDAILAVSAACIAARVDKRNVLVRLVDAPGWALPRDSQGQAGHHRIVL